MGIFLGLFTGLFIGFMYGVSYYRASGLEKDIENGLSFAETMTVDERAHIKKVILDHLSGGSAFEKWLRKKRSV
jgi:hypothetical protein